MIVLGPPINLEPLKYTNLGDVDIVSEQGAGIQMTFGTVGTFRFENV
jgi:hypothetical protein